MQIASPSPGASVPCLVPPPVNATCLANSANPGTTPLEAVEVQTGARLHEDDIIRHDDACGRTDRCLDER